MGMRITLLIVLASSLAAPRAWVRLAGVDGQQTPNSSADARVQEFFDEGSRSFAKGDYADAARKFQQALAIEPDSPQLLSNLGITLHMEGQPEQAVRVLRQALARDPNLLPANLILGLDLVKLGKPEQAVAPLKNALARAPSNRDVQLGLASAYFALHQFSEAADLYREAVRLQPKDADAWYGMGICFEHLAENTARMMAHQAPDSPYYHRLIGEFLLREGNELDAAQAFRQALTASHGDDDLGLRAALGFTLARLGQSAESERDFDAELKLHPGSLQARMGLAAVGYLKGENEQAAEQLCEVYDIDPAFYESQLNLLASALGSTDVKSLFPHRQQDARHSHCAAAIELLQKELIAPETISTNRISFDLHPETSWQDRVAPAMLTAAESARNSGHYTQCTDSLAGSSLSRVQDALLLAQCACLSGRFLVALRAAHHALTTEPQRAAALYWEAESAQRLAQAAFARAVTLDPHSWQGHILLGDIYRQRKQWKLAILNYQEAARLKPSSPAPYLGLATVHWQNGEFPQAESALKRTLALDATNLQANFELGDIQVRRHQFQQAISHLQKVIAGEPDLLAAHADLGKCFAALGQAKSATQELRLALPTDRDGNLHYLLSLQYKKEGQTALASQALTESQRLREEALRMQQTRLQQALEAAKRKQAAQP
jgi:Flp pilus assembly protein TadD